MSKCVKMCQNVLRCVIMSFFCPHARPLLYMITLPLVINLFITPPPHPPPPHPHEPHFRFHPCCRHLYRRRRSVEGFKYISHISHISQHQPKQEDNESLITKNTKAKATATLKHSQPHLLFKP